MAWKTLLSICASWLSDANTMLVSAFCHLSLLIAVALVSVGSPVASGDRKITVQLGGGNDASADVGPLTMNDSTGANESPAASDSKLQANENFDAALKPSTAAFGSAPLTTESIFGGLKIPAPTTGVSKLGTPDGQPQGVGLALSGLGGGAHGDARRGGGSSAKASTDFFGIGGYGQTFVYVVDCSNSMNENGKFDRARYELLQSIEKLDHDQKYFVIFYNHHTHPMDGERPILASGANVSETTRWVNLIEASGGTNPLPALLTALSMRPDAIYFLSDGLFDPNTIGQLRIRNAPNRRLRLPTIPIHTIAFVDRLAEGIMRTIARDSGGEYRFVK